MAIKQITLDFIVGIFVAIGIACLLFLAIKVVNDADFTNSSSNSYTLSAHFDNIGSLKVNSPVKVSGLAVGRVVNIELDKNNYQAIVTMEINKHYQFTTDTSAQILTVGLLGEQYISLQSGADKTYLTNGSTINFTSSAMVLENLISKFMTNLNAK